MVRIAYMNNNHDVMKLLQKIIGGVWFVSTLAMPFLGIGFNIVYLYVHFSGRFEWWWNSRCAWVLFLMLVADIIISICTHICNKLFLGKDAC